MIYFYQIFDCEGKPVEVKPSCACGDIVAQYQGMMEYLKTNYPGGIAFKIKSIMLPT